MIYFRKKSYFYNANFAQPNTFLTIVPIIQYYVKHDTKSFFIYEYNKYL